MDLKYICPYLDSSGYGIAAYHIVRQLVKDKNFNLELIRLPFMDNPLGNPVRKDKFENKNHFKKDYISLTYATPENFRYRKNAKLNILMTTWEFKELPIHWISPIIKADYIITSSNFDSEAFKQYNENTFILPFGVESYFRPIKINKFDKFTFLMVTDYNLRKGIDIGLKAFKVIEEKYKDVQLYIKTYKSVISEWNKLIAKYKIKNVIVDTNFYEEEEYNELYNKAHVVLFPTRAEGFGLPALEAFATGIPLIVTNYSGVTDFCDASNSYLLSYKMTKISKEFIAKSIIHNKSMKWAEPNFDELVSVMEYLYGMGPDEKKIKNGLKVAQEYTWDNTYKKFKSILIELNKGV